MGTKHCMICPVRLTHQKINAQYCAVKTQEVIVWFNGVDMRFNIYTLLT